MKKFLGAIVSGLAGVLSLVFLSIPAFTVDLTISTEKYSGWKLLKTEDFDVIAKSTNKETLTALTWYRILTWILIVVAVVLIVLAVLQLLSALKVVKMPAIIDTAAKYALIVLAVVSILALIANIGIRSEIINTAKDLGLKDKALDAVKDMYAVGASLWIVAIVNAIAAVCGNLFAKKAK
ncbi:MAG: hypothetical protein ACLRFE_00080 [Clostridia bacterium]